MEVDFGDFHGFADGDEGGEVDYGLAGFFVHDGDEALGIEEVEDAQAGGVYGFAMAAREVVDDYNVVTGVEELEGGVGADVAGASGDENAGWGGGHFRIVNGEPLTPNGQVESRMGAGADG
jgi:hypothetical protein